jgi:hypothetical protein
MRKRPRAGRGAAPSAIVSAAIEASASAHGRESRLLELEVETLSPRVRSRLGDDRAASDLERRRLLDRLARLGNALAALATSRDDRPDPAADP